MDQLSERAYRLLEASYELSEARPTVMLFAEQAARKAGIPCHAESCNPVAIYLKRFGLIKEPDGAVGFYVFRITPNGIRAVEYGRP